MEEDYNNPQVIELRNHVREVVTRTVAEQRISFIQNITSFSENPNKIQTKVIFFCVIIIWRIDKWLKILLVNIIPAKYLIYRIADLTYVFLGESRENRYLKLFCYLPVFQRFLGPIVLFLGIPDLKLSRLSVIENILIYFSFTRNITGTYV